MVVTNVSVFGLTELLSSTAIEAMSVIGNAEMHARRIYSNVWGSAESFRVIMDHDFALVPV
jgi:hypothetical protein